MVDKVTIKVKCDMWANFVNEVFKSILICIYIFVYVYDLGFNFFPSLVRNL